MVESKGRDGLSDSKGHTDKHHELKSDQESKQWALSIITHWGIMLWAVTSLSGRSSRCWASWGLGWLLQLASFFPQRASLRCVSPWRAQCWISSPRMEKWKGNRRKKERSYPCNHRTDLSSVPVFRVHLEGNNNQGHSGKWMQHRLPPGKTHWLYFFD